MTFPIFHYHFFATLDGPAHLYNSQLINQILFNPSNSITEFYEFNTRLVPNWISHFILSFLSTFLAPNMAEKCMMLIYFIGLSLAYRKLIHLVNPKNMALSYLILPFMYSLPFKFGFFSFCLSTIFMLLILFFWFKNQSEHRSNKTTSLLAFLFILLYFSHLLVFIVTIFLLCTAILYEFVYGRFITKNNYLLSINNLKERSYALFIASVIPLCFSVYYFLTRNSEDNNWTFLHDAELLEILAIFGNNHGFYKYTYLTICLVLMTFGVIRRLIFAQKNPKEIRFFINDFWLIASLIIFFLYLIIPEFIGRVGFISMRFSLIFYLILSIWIITLNIPKWLMIVASIVIIYNQYDDLKTLDKMNSWSNKQIEDVLLVSAHIEDGSVVYPIMSDDQNWNSTHYSNYLGINKPLVILENYECYSDHFPLRWNKNLTIKKHPGMNLFQDEFNLTWKGESEISSVQIDYVFILGSLDKIVKKELELLKDYISKDYALFYRNDNCELYKRN